MQLNKHNKKFKILIIAPKYSLTEDRFYTYYFPMSLAYIISVLKKQGYEVDVLNLNHHNGTIKEIIERKLDKRKYDFVCTGGMAIFYSIIEKMLKTIRSHHSNPKIILGGLILTSEKEFISKHLDFDYGIINEGEETIINLLKCLENKKDLSKVKGIVYFNENKPVFTPDSKPPMNLDKIPFPDVEALEYEEWLDNQIPNKSYVFSLFDQPRMYDVVGSRSCPYQCTFCYHYSSLYRKRSIENIFLELRDVVKKYGINLLFFYDECLAVDRKRLKDICENLKQLQREIGWELKWIPNLRVDLITDEMLAMLKDSNCAMIGYGLESYSPEILKSMNKGITPHQIDVAIKKTLSAGIGLMSSFILGDIAETNATASTTLDYWEKHCEDQINLDFVRPYPKSKLYEYCIKNGIIRDKLKFMKDLIKEDDFAIKMAKNMTDSEFNKLKSRVQESISKHRKIAKNLSIKKTSRGIYEINVKCPFCKETITYGNCHIPNRYNFSFTVRCRKCPKRFYIASSLRKLALRNYKIAKYIKNFNKRLRNSIKEKMI